jgi:hypothetical protein
MEKHEFSWANNAVCQYYAWERKKNVVGCGLWLDSDDKLAIFFTVNGKHCGQFYAVQ